MKFHSFRVVGATGLGSLILGLTVILLADKVAADDATWSSNPRNEAWDNPANWAPATVPNGPNDTATFVFSAGTTVNTEADIELDSLVFEPEAAAFTVWRGPDAFFDRALTFRGAGVVNNSSTTQTFVVGVNLSGRRGALNFFNSASAGHLTLYTALGAIVTPARAGFINFADTSTAADATFVVESGMNLHSTLFHRGGSLHFSDTASAGNGHFTVNGGQTNYSLGGELTFSSKSTGDHGIFVNNGGTQPKSSGGEISFGDQASAGTGTYTNNGGTVVGSGGAFLTFFDEATAGTATLIGNGDAEMGEAAVIQFYDVAEASGARIMVFGTGTLDISAHDSPGISVGSLEGDGQVVLGARSLAAGSNNQDSTFSGMIQDGPTSGGSLSKIGAGLLKLTEANSYTGGTTVSEGGLAINNTSGSGTGAGPVQVDGGTLAGSGIIAGAVTIGTGSGIGAILAPGQAASRPATLTIQSSLTFKPDATYSCRLNSRKAKSDRIIANGVTIENGAQFDFQAIGRDQLRPGKVATLLSNTAATPIAGAFANLHDGSTLSVGSNTLRVSYSGGDGNDLTLTVVP